MAILALLNEYFLFNSVNLSDHTTSCVLTANADALDSTAMGDSWRENTGGLKAGTLAATLHDDFAGGSVDATIWAAFDANVAVAVAVRPVNTTIAATNPEYQVNVLPNQWQMGGQVGTLAQKQLSYPTTGAMVRDTTP
ncbi:hypothetical protein Rhe02_54930 [Rhizocola hellebori]|uniref:Uncharacterized protein n=1 Tax=Rhizocola hellebori TaxID=1392758 RepID=A0A8J3QBB9_9ACTN|nr:radical SAM protein [Rhizocola hellebori]GIH07426.1 hypothetical protein Rhe02_54930 [Rhizocola hellebori]